MARMTKGLRLQEAGIAVFRDQMLTAGFTPDEVSPLVFVGEQPTPEPQIGYGVAFIDERVETGPTRWTVQPQFGWVVPDVDAVKEAVDGDRSWSLATVREYSISATDDEYRHNHKRPAEYHELDDFEKYPYLTRQARVLAEHWSWWTTNFVSLDATLAYLKQWLLDQWPNWDTGYVLALLHDRPDEALEYVHLHLCRATFHESEQRFAEQMDRFRAFADAAGKTPPPLPGFGELDFDELSARYNPHVRR